MDYLQEAHARIMYAATENEALAARCVAQDYDVPAVARVARATGLVALHEATGLRRAATIVQELIGTRDAPEGR